MVVHRIFLAISVFGLLLTARANAQEATIVQPFAGSTHLGQYAAEFDQVTVLKGKGDAVEPLSVEGVVRTSVFRPPEGKSILEIRHSFKRALRAAGFEILYNGKVNDNRHETTEVARKANTPRTYKNIGNHQVYRSDLDSIYTFPQHYISSVREQNGQKTVFSIILSAERGNIYLTEEATSGVQEEGTVTISEASLSREMEEAGKAVLYGIQFDVGSAVIRPTSASSLDVIAKVLKARPGLFYVVGHTSDTGSFELNMKLSRQRAEAIVSALGTQYGIDTSRLLATGVGPAAPLASNKNEAGQQLNRRVELVDRLDR